jgi:hypothetical protein
LTRKILAICPKIFVRYSYFYVEMEHRYFQKMIAQTPGLDVAAYAIEQAFKKNQSVDSAGERAELSHA